MQFKDHFSTRSAEYAQFRPRYPVELFEYLAGIAPDRSRAWDCATGNGQAAIGLARFFKSVIATDASESKSRTPSEMSALNIVLLRPIEVSSSRAASVS